MTQDKDVPLDNEDVIELENLLGHVLNKPLDGKFIEFEKKLDGVREAIIKAVGNARTTTSDSIDELLKTTKPLLKEKNFDNAVEVFKQEIVQLAIEVKNDSATQLSGISERLDIKIEDAKKCLKDLLIEKTTEMFNEAKQTQQYISSQNIQIISQLRELEKKWALHLVNILGQVENKADEAKACLTEQLVEVKTELLASLDATEKKQEEKINGVVEKFLQLSVKQHKETELLSSRIKILIVISAVNLISLFGIGVVMLTR